ncbi:hypothetical protein LB523_12180 [Mesorhizobium sp. ESP-6-4]|uniref:DUF6511 domain-containing protein n=1 Tax=Mesorhizobium sp. ESP-6-4 TaxID=2876624 RepID=UPI001CC90E45|nr:DUF6511 domain-containing protein [Mesorhizobium sp. ESP-6-4]MBZ9659804.1 hypothetical protein [Mesorhizobium sp. ESP-6-4]
MTTTAKQPNHDPDACHVCGRHAIGIGVGQMRRPTDDPRWLCAECLPLLEYVKDIRRWDAYEIKASELAGQDAGAYADSIGKTDLAIMDDVEWMTFRNTMIRGFGKHIRRLIRDGEAPW